MEADRGGESVPTRSADAKHGRARTDLIGSLGPACGSYRLGGRRGRRTPFLTRPAAGPIRFGQLSRQLEARERFAVRRFNRLCR